MPEVSRELRLLIACAAWPRTGERRSAIRVAAEDVDWVLFLDAIKRHRIATLALSALADADVAVPSHIRAWMRERAGADARAILTQIAEIGAITHLLKGKGIQSSVLKGPSLSLLAFGTPAMRQSRDIDILVAPEAMFEARAALISAGHQHLEPLGAATREQLALWLRFQKDILLRNPRTGSLIELHARVVDNPYLLPMSGPTEGSATVMLAAGVEVEALQGDALVLYLSIHGARHCWVRLKWLADVAALMRNYDAAGIERLRAHARQKGAHIPLDLALSLIDDVFAALPKGTRPPSPGLRVRLLRRASLRVMTDMREQYDTSFASTTIGAAQFLLSLDPRFFLHELIGKLVDWKTAGAHGVSWGSIIASVLLRPVTWPVRKFRAMADRSGPSSQPGIGG